MDIHAERKFNLIREAWIPVSDHGLVSLHEIFSNPKLAALGGNPLQKISVLKLLLAIAQAAATPEDDDAWQTLGAEGMAAKARNYLQKHEDRFWLYGDKPFLQIPAIRPADTKVFATVNPEVANGNTVILFESQIPTPLDNAEIALQLLVLSACALGGKQTDNSVALSPGYQAKTAAGKSGPALGYLGYLHNFIVGRSILETIWLNLFTAQNLKEMRHFESGLGTPPWEAMPTGEADAIANQLKESYMGRLIPLSRFVLLTADGLHYSEGLAHPSHKDGAFDPSVAVTHTKNMQAVWTDPEKRPWRQLPALLAFLDVTSEKDFDCLQLRLGLRRDHSHMDTIGAWSGGLRVASNAGEQFVSGRDDYVESEIQLQTAWLNRAWFLRFKREMADLENLSKQIYGAVNGYYGSQKMDGEGQAAKAANLFWQLAENHFQALVDACADETGEATIATRKIFAKAATRAYDTFAPKKTARQLTAWAANRPQFTKYLDIKQRPAKQATA